jgi:hypothetical protein
MLLSAPPPHRGLLSAAASFHVEETDFPRNWAQGAAVCLSRSAQPRLSWRPTSDRTVFDPALRCTKGTAVYCLPTQYIAPSTLAWRQRFPAGLDWAGRWGWGWGWKSLILRSLCTKLTEKGAEANGPIRAHSSSSCCLRGKYFVHQYCPVLRTHRGTEIQGSIRRCRVPGFRLRARARRFGDMLGISRPEMDIRRPEFGIGTYLCRCHRSSRRLADSRFSVFAPMCLPAPGFSLPTGLA